MLDMLFHHFHDILSMFQLLYYPINIISVSILSVSI